MKEGDLNIGLKGNPIWLQKSWRTFRHGFLTLGTPEVGRNNT